MPPPTKMILLINLGSISAPTVGALRTFLGEFLSDRRVVDISRMIWFPILYGIILPFRPRRILPSYEAIWIKEGDGPAACGKQGGSPLHLYSHSLAAKMEKELHKKGQTDVIVRCGMRYGEGSVAQVLESMHADFPTVSEVVALPLFPQYTSATTATIFDSVFSFYTDPRRRRVPGLRAIRDYATNPVYVTSIGQLIVDALKAHYSPSPAAPTASWVGKMRTHLSEMAIVLSYHGIPTRFAAEGDDYDDRCKATTLAVVQYLEKETGCALARNVAHVYQSKFGKEPWLEPTLVDAAQVLPAALDSEAKRTFCETQVAYTGFDSKVVHTCFALTPGFAIDCIETLVEVGDEAATEFREHGGKDFIFVPCLNDSQAHVETLLSVVEN